jgi:hypothetical protein
VTVVENVLAGLVLCVCGVLLVRLALGSYQRQRLDAAVARRFHASRHAVQEAWRWRGAKRRAVREADDLIRRARHKARREGNVIHPESFETPRKPH